MIISGPRLPPDLLDTVSLTTVYPRELWIIFGTWSPSRMKQIDWFHFVDWVRISLIWSSILVFIDWCDPGIHAVCRAIFLAVLWQSSNPSLLIQQAIFNKRTRSWSSTYNFGWLYNVPMVSPLRHFALRLTAMVDLLELYTFGISSGSTDSVDNYTHLGLLTSQCMDLLAVHLLTELQIGTASL